ncbi:helix-turn-helix domain-containing protein [uncultured Sulfitobacter sp.]|uniref:AraC family transcriptional regulator n=1 Tax=uncultured Sulfitobacter sp. TaxID=191468 RepID=UPI00260E1728|nr:helix-turn-helix domain-containing protein [uncultured Sulfitobacter sp.]
MPSLPIPMISALVLSFLLIRLWVMDRRHGPLAMLLALCAAQGFIISFAQHYGIPFAQILQPVTASLIPPMAWVAFQATAVRRLAAHDGLHLIGPLVVAGAVVLSRPALDLLIPALFLGYGTFIIWTCLKGSDALPRMRLEAGDLPRLVWQIIGGALILSAASDGVIVLAQLLDMGHLQPWLISIFSSTTLIVVGALTLSGALSSGAVEVDETAPPREADPADTQIMAQLEVLMEQARPYLNPDLTMSQLSRRLRVPVKQLSGAINRVTGENVSRYINAARIAVAQKSLLAGENVTTAMLGSGFNTKSNFNREFLRVSGESPSDWLASNKVMGP